MPGERNCSAMSDLQDRILAEMDECEPYSTRELAELLDEPRRTVHYNLERLAEQGEINRKENTARHLSWWVE